MIEFISQLPTEYQEVEYIQSSGTQYIDTGYIVNASDTISWEFTAMIPSQSESEAYMGANGYLQFHVTSSGVGVSTLNASGLGAKKTFRIDFSNSVTQLYIDNTLVETKNWSGSYNGTSVKLGIFKLGDAGNGWHTTTSPVSCTLYEYAINIGGNEVSRCVPCYRKADNVAGLYDLVNNVFYTNAGSGVFAVGADSNKHAIATITPGGVIPMQYALRRRMMMRKIVKMVTLTLTGSFDNSGLFGERYVAVDGKIITELGTYKVRQGSTIILHTKISPIMGGNEKYGIFVNNKCVRTAVQCINHGPDYEYTVTCNCTINGQGKVHERGGYARIDVTTEEPI